MEFIGVIRQTLSNPSAKQINVDRNPSTDSLFAFYRSYITTVGRWSVSPKRGLYVRKTIPFFRFILIYPT